MTPEQEAKLDNVRVTVSAINERTKQHEKRMDRMHTEAQKGGAGMGALVSLIISGIAALFGAAR